MQIPDEIIAHLNEAGERWSNGRPQDDDITFVVLKVKQNGKLESFYIDNLR